MNQRLVEVNKRLAQLLAPQRELQELHSEKQRLEQQQAQAQQLDDKAARQRALHDASQKKHAALASFQAALRDALPKGKQAAESVLTEGRLLDAYWPGESEVLNKINFVLQEAIEQLDSQNWAKF